MERLHLKDTDLMRIKAMDSQHADIFHCINRLRDAVSNQDQLLSCRLFIETLDLVRTHFQDEEALLRKHSYPGLSKQIKDHDQMLKKFSPILKECQKQGVCVAFRIVEELAEELLGHIRGADRGYAEFLRDEGAR